MDFEDYVDPFEDWTDEELAKRWNYLETCKLNSYVESQMDDIETSLRFRRVVAWDNNGTITHRE